MNDHLSSRPALGDGGNLDTQAGSRGVVTQYTSDAKNVIQFPSGKSFLPDYQGFGPGLSLPDDTCALCVLAVVVSCFVVAMSAMLYAGYSLFFLFDFG